MESPDNVLDQSSQHLTSIEGIKSFDVLTLILDDNDLVKLDNIDKFKRLEQVKYNYIFFSYYKLVKTMNH